VTVRIEDCVDRHIRCDWCGRAALVRPAQSRLNPDPAMPSAEIRTAWQWYRRECPACGVKLFQRGHVVTPVESAGAT
jgi:hypothetical protein